MSILIKNMDMPSSCNECQLLEGDSMDGLCRGANRWLDDDDWLWIVYEDGTVVDDKPANCPLIEIPIPNGRSIEEKIVRDIAVEWIRSLINDIGQTKHQDLWHYGQVLSEIIDLLQPQAVIESEE